MGGLIPRFEGMTEREMIIQLFGEINNLNNRIEIYERGNRESFERHLKESGGNILKFDRDISAAHRRIDDHEKDQKAVIEKLKEEEIKPLKTDVSEFEKFRVQILTVVGIATFVVGPLVYIIAQYGFERMVGK